MEVRQLDPQITSAPIISTQEGTGEIAQQQAKDPVLQEVMSFVRKGEKPPHYKGSAQVNAHLKEFDKFCIVKEVLYRKVPDPVQGEIYQVVIPEALRSSFLALAHDWGHAGREKT